MKICIVRHGETDWNISGRFQGREDTPMNSTGAEQIKQVAKYLKKFSWKVIITSPLSRAKVSAEIISKEAGNIPIYEEADLVERDHGKASGMTAEERNFHFPDGVYPDMESFEALQSRTVKALLKYTKEFEGNDIIVVSHGAAIRSMLAFFFGEKSNAGKSLLQNACITLLEKTDDTVEVVFFNKTAGELLT